ncbi:hypothetical protein DdX_14354 [Ditylenchus destructor]|uniref:Uncharacterized protein n=1 Tax=Ditylenchus destructor TaxID=166010 RepID=A0AAD4MUK1_9BILA|nr:hypothetical protein DdX_14354 [Ditylenchus destructor]
MGSPPDCSFVWAPQETQQLSHISSQDNPSWNFHPEAALESANFAQNQREVVRWSEKEESIRQKHSLYNFEPLQPKASEFAPKKHCRWEEPRAFASGIAPGAAGRGKPVLILIAAGDITAPSSRSIASDHSQLQGAADIDKQSFAREC